MSDELAAFILEELREIRAIVASVRGPESGLLTKAQVAARLGGKCSVRKVERIVQAGKLKPVPNLGRRTVRFRPVDVERFLADRENRPGARRL